MPEDPNRTSLREPKRKPYQKSVKASGKPTEKLDNILAWMGQRVNVTPTSFITKGKAPSDTKVPRWAAWFIARHLYGLKVYVLEFYFGVNRKAIYWAENTICQTQFDPDMHRKYKNDMEYFMMLLKENPFFEEKETMDAFNRMLADYAERNKITI